MFDRTILYESCPQRGSAGPSVRLTETGAQPVQEERCPKCGGAMQTGFILDRSHASNFQEEWVQGRPRSFLFRVILRGAVRQKVMTYRCGGCGFLESYALAKAEHPSLDDAVRQAALVSGFWRVVRFALAWLPGGLFIGG